MSEKKNDVWSIDELVSLTETIQKKELEYNGKMINPSMSDEEQNAHFAKLAGARVGAMIAKANEKNPEGTFITTESWVKLPTTLRWNISNTIMQTDNKSDF